VIGCICVPCHATGGNGFSIGKLDMSSQPAAYTNLVNVKAAGSQCGTKNLTRVVPDSASTSLMWEKINAKTTGTAAPCGDPMPENMQALTSAQVTEVQQWINAGAPNN
jgi:hypothetical protein